MNTPLVSVIVPVYNVEKTLVRCLESICGQSYQNLEIIVVNDGSPDGSLPSVSSSGKRPPRGGHQQGERGTFSRSQRWDARCPRQVFAVRGQ